MRLSHRLRPPPATSGATHGRPGAPAGDPYDGRILRAAARSRSADVAIGGRQRPLENRPVSRWQSGRFDGRGRNARGAGCPSLPVHLPHLRILHHVATPAPPTALRYTNLPQMRKIGSVSV
jgi:hypothetical protein